MKVKDMVVSDCILAEIVAFEQGQSTFEAVRTAHGKAMDPQTETQFSESKSACGAACTYVKEGGGDRLGGIYLALDHPTTAAELRKQFGEFKNLPPSPSRKWTAIAYFKSETSAQSYAVILNAKEKIESETPIREITIRIDYAE